MLISQVRSARPESMVAFADALGRANMTFVDALTAVDRSVHEAESHWKGDAATAAALRALSERMVGTHIETAVADLAGPFADFGLRLEDTKASLLDIVDREAPAAGMAVTDDGTVTAPTLYGADAVAVGIAQSALDDAAQWFRSRIRELLTQVDTLDGEATSAIGDAVAGLAQLRRSPEGGPIGGAVTDIISGASPLPTDPSRLQDLWQQLSPAEKDALYDHDRFIGNRDGIPHIDRDHFNRQNLGGMQAAAQRDLERILSAHDAYPDEDQWNQAVDDARSKLSGLETVAGQVDADTEPPRYLALIDDRGHAAVAINNPDTADSVATFVPGTGANLGDLPNGVERSRAMYDAALAADYTKQHSVISWYGYDAPQNALTESPFEGYADAAAEPLDRFQDGLRATHEGATASSNTVIGHSYGTTVIGHAASDGHTLDADQLLLVASPGIGVFEASELSLTGVDPSATGDHVFATTNAHDPIRFTPDQVHFTQPIDNDFGARVFTADEDSKGPWWALGIDLDLHSTYWDRDNPALSKMGQIVAGKGDEVG
ncbi:alpha/beta hydrolase [Rhodococcus sp. TAF43]|uniref:alpha/beta hydrolase n=1 Tax=Rhodococcus sp. TAF43 TaxID=3237483 RepID=UPI003F9A444D